MLCSLNSVQMCLSKHVYMQRKLAIVDIKDAYLHSGVAFRNLCVQYAEKCAIEATY